MFSRRSMFATSFALLVVSVVAVHAETLKYDDDSADGKKSIGGSGEILRFELGEKAREIKGLQIHGSRYGVPQAPDEDFLIYFMNADMSEVLAVRMAPYSLFERGDNKWVNVAFKQPVSLSGDVWVVLDFRAHQRKGVYVSYDASTDGKKSRVGLPGQKLQPVDFKGDWMIRLETGS